MNIEMKIMDKRLLESGMFPKYAKGGDAGIDVRACIDELFVDNYYKSNSIGRPLVCDNRLTLYPNMQVAIPLGFSVHINNPEVMMMIVPRSGLGSKGLVLGNLTGIIDSGFQGQLSACLWNRSEEPIEIKAMDRIAQAIFVPILRPMFNIVEEFSSTSERGEGGYGSSGKE
jgi:dUTP pyrophosphatase